MRPRYCDSRQVWNDRHKMSALAHSTRTKMFGFIKNLLRRPSENPAEQQSVATGNAPAAPLTSGTSAQSTFRTTPLRRNLGQSGNGKGVEVSLQNILSGLPLELQPRIRQADVGE